MFEVGRMCIKLAGRDAGLKCVIVDVKDNGRVLIDGQTRRREVNTKHLEPLTQTIDIRKGASHSKVKEAFEDLSIEVRDTTPKKSTERPKKSKVVKEGPTEEPAEEEPAEDSEAGDEGTEKETPSRSKVESMTKDEIKEYAADEWDVELSTNDLKDEMIEQLFEEIEN